MFSIFAAVNSSESDEFVADNRQNGQAFIFHQNLFNGFFIKFNRIVGHKKEFAFVLDIGEGSRRHLAAEVFSGFRRKPESQVN